MLVSKTLSTFRALVTAFSAVNTHMITQVTLKCKTLSTLTAGIQLLSSVTYFVIIQLSVCYKPFVTHRTHIRPWLVIMWMLSDIITISFRLHIERTFICDLNFKRTLTYTICTTQDAILNKQ